MRQQNRDMTTLTVVAPASTHWGAASMLSLIAGRPFSSVPPHAHQHDAFTDPDRSIERHRKQQPGTYEYRAWITDDLGTNSAAQRGPQMVTPRPAIVGLTALQSSERG